MMIERDDDATAFEKAQKIPAREYKGWICRPDGEEEPNYGYHKSVDDLMRTLLNRDCDLPQFVWATMAEGLSLNADWILEEALEEHHENARDQISREAEEALQALLDGWLKRPDVKVTTYHEDRSRAVVFDDEDRARFAEMKAQYVAVSTEPRPEAEAPEG